MVDENKNLLMVLQRRFEENTHRHKGLDWNKVQEKLESNPKKMKSLEEMEKTGGEPDVIGYDSEKSEFIFCDCSAESPVGRRNLCYDDEALASRKENKPKGSAVGVAGAMGVELLTEEWYWKLQELGEFDTKTSSWVVTPEEVRKLGGALFCDRRFDRVFTFHNGAESYYGGRGFRGLLRV